MTKSRSSAVKNLSSAAAAAPEGAAITAAKRSISLRLDNTTRQLIDDAAALLGKTRTEFMVDSAKQQANDIILEQRLYSLSEEHYDAFIQALDNPPAPGPKLRSLMRRAPVWKS